MPTIDLGEWMDNFLRRDRHIKKAIRYSRSARRDLRDLRKIDPVEARVRLREWNRGHAECQAALADLACEAVRQNRATVGELFKSYPEFGPWLRQARETYEPTPKP